MLARAGLAVPEGIRARDADSAARAAARLGFPVALKALGVAHKTEANAVRLGLADAQAIQSAAADLLPLGDGLLVERMVANGVAELIVGIVRDPLFGPVLTLGTGGVQAELLADTATLLLPAARPEIETALRGLKLFPLLDGYRGRPNADLAAAIDAIGKVAAFALANAGALDELDVNPLIVCSEGSGAWVADALLSMRETRPAASRDMEAAAELAG